MLTARLPDDPDLVTEIAHENEVQQAVYEFNRRPRRGVAALCQTFQTAPTPRAIAHLLHTISGLLSEQIGQYLSQCENEAILTAYFLELDLRGAFLPALRQALSTSLHLPGEGEQIDRVVQAWAQCWVSQNPGCGYDGDQAHILAFACVLLNSDLHNPAVTRRMSVSSFISNVRGALPAKTVADGALTEIYESIRTAPFSFRRTNGDEFLALAAPRLRGPLEKRRDTLFSSWTAHYFVLTDGCLYYFRDDRPASADSGPLGVIQLVNVAIQSLEDNKIQIVAKGGELQYVKFERGGPQLVRGVTAMILRAASTKRREKWLYRMRTAYVFANLAGETGAGGSPGDLKSVSEVASTSTTEGEGGPEDDTRSDSDDVGGSSAPTRCDGVY
jgi:hypothetical protein